jgi:antitoxin component of RelBE/YafQ-DinJ toxin-antitoxin module
VPKKTPPRRTRPNQVPLRVDDEEKEAFFAAAERAGMTFTDWARFLLRRGAGLPVARARPAKE